MEALDTDGAWTAGPQVHQDDRGSFAEAFRGVEFAADLGYQFNAAQVNCSVSRRGVIRGICDSDVPPGRAKYVSCAAGAVLDVVVDLRVGSPGFCKWETMRLDDDYRHAVFPSEDLGHCSMGLSEQAIVIYLRSTPYALVREHGIHPLDPAFGIALALDGQTDAPILSDKDAAAPSLEDALLRGALPSYGDCVANTKLLRAALD